MRKENFVFLLCLGIISATTIIQPSEAADKSTQVTFQQHTAIETLEGRTSPSPANVWLYDDAAVTSLGFFPSLNEATNLMQSTIVGFTPSGQPITSPEQLLGNKR